MNISTLIGTRLEHLRNARRTREDLEKHRLAKFRKLVTHAVAHSPYYRDIVASSRVDVSRCTPEDFPPLTKSDLMRNFDRIVANPRITLQRLKDFLERSKDPYDLLDGEFYVVHTSGSTGEVGIFVFSRRDWTHGLAHALRINPPSLRRRRLAFFGATGGHFAGASFAATCRRPVIRHLYDVALFEINSPLVPIIEGLNRFQPNILMGYSSALGLLAQRQLQGMLGIRPKWIQSSGEPVLDADRSLIEEAFGVPLFNVYSCSEHLIMGWSRPEFDGMYLFEDELIFEFHPDHTLITNLFNFTLPLIRYRMTDVLVEKDDPDGELPYRKVHAIVGRSEHIPFFYSDNGGEDFISPHTLNEFLVPNVSRFQFVAVDRTAAVLRVQLEEGLDSVARRRALANSEVRLRELFAQKDMQGVQLRVQEVPGLTADPKTGKFRLIVNSTDSGA
jgi:phenylacetate-CoA ligase